MTNDFLPLFGIAAFFVGLLALIFGFVRDIRFYWRNSWNFDLNSGESMYFGFLNALGGSVPNKVRIFLGWPFLVLGFSFAIFMTIDQYWTAIQKYFL